MTTAYLYGPPECLTHPDVAAGKIQAIPCVSFYPLDSAEDQARAVGEHWLKFPNQSPALSVGGWFGAEAFMLNGIQADGRNFGTDEHKWQTGIMPRAFAVDRLKTAAWVWKQMGAPMPTLVHWDAEFNSTPAPKEQGPYNKLKCDYLNSCLKDAGINGSVKTLVVEFTQWGDPRDYVVNGDGVEQVVSPVRPRCKSSCQFYSHRQVTEFVEVPNLNVTERLGTWACGVAPGGFPFIDVRNQDHTDRSLRIIRKMKHNVIFYVDAGWPVSVGNQVAWAVQALERMGT